MPPEPCADILQTRPVEVRHRADRGVVIGMAVREKRLLFGILDEAIGLVVVLPFLVLHHTALAIERRLADRAEQMPHSIAFEEQRQRQRRGRHRLEIIGAIEAGGAVVVGRAHLLERAEEIARRILRSVEHQMFEQMGEARPAGGLVLGTGVIPDRHRHHRRLAIGRHHHAQAVGEGELLERQPRLARDCGEGRGLHRRCGGERRKRSGREQESRQAEAHHHSLIDTGRATISPCTGAATTPALLATTRLWRTPASIRRSGAADVAASSPPRTRPPLSRQGRPQPRARGAQRPPELRGAPPDQP